MRCTAQLSRAWPAAARAAEMVSKCHPLSRPLAATAQPRRTLHCASQPAHAHTQQPSGRASGASSDALFSPLCPPLPSLAHRTARGADLRELRKSAAALRGCRSQQPQARERTEQSRRGSGTVRVAAPTSSAVRGLLRRGGRQRGSSKRSCAACVCRQDRMRRASFNTQQQQQTADSSG